MTTGVRSRICPKRREESLSNCSMTKMKDHTHLLSRLPNQYSPSPAARPSTPPVNWWSSVAVSLNHPQKRLLRLLLNASRLFLADMAMHGAMHHGLTIFSILFQAESHQAACYLVVPLILQSHLCAKQRGRVVSTEAIPANSYTKPKNEKTS